MIKAEVHRDDFRFQTDFDAEPWFKQASDEDILALVKCGWGGDYPADVVAQYVDSFVRNSPVSAVLEACTCEEQMGFECHVDEASAKAWLAHNRQGLYGDLVDQGLIN